MPFVIIFRNDRYPQIYLGLDIYISFVDIRNSFFVRYPRIFRDIYKWHLKIEIFTDMPILSVKQLDLYLQIIWIIIHVQNMSNYFMAICKTINNYLNVYIQSDVRTYL